MDAATSMKEAGNSTLDLSREIITLLSSNGPRSDSVMLFGSWANSSRNRMPFWASETSPGMMFSPFPPPITAAREAL